MGQRRVTQQAWDLGLAGQCVGVAWHGPFLTDFVCELGRGKRV